MAKKGKMGFFLDELVARFLQSWGGWFLDESINFTGRLVRGVILELRF